VQKWIPYNTKPTLDYTLLHCLMQRVLQNSNHSQMSHISDCQCNVCVRACERARARACVRVCVCECVSERISLLLLCFSNSPPERTYLTS
jgi:hypothetical protein